MALAPLAACSSGVPVPADGAVQAHGFSLRSPAVADGEALPAEFTGDGAGRTPPLAWSGAPAGTRSYALVMDHVDAQNATFSYWVLYDIPAGMTALASNATDVGTLGLSSRGNHQGYTPPHSAGPGKKAYTLTLYALSAQPRMTVPAQQVTREVLLDAIKPITLGSATLHVTYTRPDDAGSGEPPQPK